MHNTNMKFHRLAGLSMLICISVAWGGAAQAQLPDSFNGWTTASFQPITAGRLAEFAGADAPLLREYGFLAGEHRDYSKGDAKLTVTLWRMKDSSGSYGLFSYYREIGTASMEAGDRVAIWPNRLLIQHGPYLMDAQGARLTIGEAKQLLARIPALRREDNLVPLLPGFLPEENLVAQSPKFVMGPVGFARLEKDLPASAIGFDLGAEAEIAQYRVDGNVTRLVIVSYATPQLASKELRSFQQLPTITQRTGDQEIFLQRKGPLICFVLGAPTPADARTLLADVRYENEVTWNQYVPTRKDNVVALILNVFLLAGFVLLFALVAGLSFGGIRILAKKFLPIPIFDRPSQIEIIRLHLSDR